jgi:hypothetical protein
MIYIQPIADWLYCLQTKSGILSLALVLITSIVAVIFGGTYSGLSNFIQKSIALFAMMQVPAFIIFISVRNVSDVYNSVHIFSSFTLFIFLFITVALILLSIDFRNNIIIGLFMSLSMSAIISVLFIISYSILRKII